MSEINDTPEQPKVEISVKNFGPIVEANIDLHPLTVFVGPSNTGKTYFATLVYALHGAFNEFSGSGFGPFIDPENVFDNLGKLITNRKGTKEEIQEILKKLNIADRPFKLSDIDIKVSDLSNEIIQQLGIITENSESTKEQLNGELKNCFDMNSISELMRFIENKRNEITIKLKIVEKNKDCWYSKMMVSESEVNLSRSTSFDNPELEDMVILPKGYSATCEFIDNNRIAFTGFRIHRGTSRFYLPAARSGIMQSHRVIATSLVKRSTRVGLERFPEVPTMSGVIADFMERIILFEDDNVSENEMQHIAETLETEVLSGHILMKPTMSGYPEFRYTPQGTNEEIRLSQSSSMVSELAPLVLYLRGLVQPGDMLIIEEPEAHLHPGAQADMAVILARLVRAGVRVIVTTHSDWLLQEIGNLILEGLIENETDEPASWLLPEEVGVWHFQKDTPVKEISFKSRKGISPEDYEDVAEGLYNRSVNLQQKYEKQKGKNGRESA